MDVLDLFSHVRLCDPMDGSPLGSSLHGIFQARILELVAIFFFSLGHLPQPRTEPGSVASQADSLPSEPPGKPIINVNLSKLGDSEREALPAAVHRATKSQTQTWLHD